MLQYVNPRLPEVSIRSIVSLTMRFLVYNVVNYRADQLVNDLVNLVSNLVAELAVVLTVTNTEKGRNPRVTLTMKYVIFLWEWPVIMRPKAHLEPVTLMSRKP